MRLMDGHYQIAKNCGTGVETIEKFYAAHMKNTLGAASINVGRPKPTPRAGRWPAKNADADCETFSVSPCAPAAGALIGAYPQETVTHFLSIKGPPDWRLRHPIQCRSAHSRRRADKGIGPEGLCRFDSGHRHQSHWLTLAPI
jgi:hypothetical protein